MEVSEEHPTDNPMRTGRFFVVRDEAIVRLIQPESLQRDILRRRMGYVPRSLYERIMPEPEKPEKGDR